MTKILTKLRIDEVSSVDRGAGEGVKIILMKRDPNRPTRDKRSTLLNKMLTLFAKEAADDNASAADFEDTLSDNETGDLADAMVEQIGDAVDTLRTSLCSIVGDDSVADKQAMIDESIAQFKDHIEGLVPEQVEKAVILGLAARTLRKGAKIGADHQDYLDQCDMEDDEKEKFLAMSPAEREAYIKKNPIQKHLALRKRLQALEQDKALADFAKRAADIGLPDHFGETLMKAHRGEGSAIRKLENAIAGLNEQIRLSKLFSEFGTAQGGDATSAAARMMAKVAELRQADPKIKSDDIAIAKIASDPANRELWRAYKDETTKAA